MITLQFHHVHHLQSCFSRRTFFGLSASRNEILPESTGLIQNKPLEKMRFFQNQLAFPESTGLRPIFSSRLLQKFTTTTSGKTKLQDGKFARNPIGNPSSFFPSHAKVRDLKINRRSSGSNTWRYVSTIFLAIFCGDIP